MQQNAAFMAEAYKRQQVMTATPEALTLMLYNGALRFMTEGVEAIKHKDFEKANSSLIKAQNIILELSSTLKMEYEIAQQLAPLYNYVYDSLVEGNMKNNSEKIEEAKGIVTELRDAWNQAMKIARKEKGAS
jgi:flagellar biosynthetic protein FliS